MTKENQQALDMADYTLERLSIDKRDWSGPELLSLGRDLLRYTALQALSEGHDA